MIFGTFDPRIFAATVFALLVWFSVFRKRRLTPPGPRGWPLIGNMFDVPRRESWKVYLEWSNRYSECTNRPYPVRQRASPRQRYRQHEGRWNTVHDLELRQSHSGIAHQEIQHLLG
jgi:hypothetical protein